jgi:transcriptional regulator with XRE-family HTH domain
MTPTELRTARTELGLSAQAFARLIGVHDGRTVRRWEHGEAPIPGLLPLYLDLRLMLQDVLQTVPLIAYHPELLEKAEKMLSLPTKRRLQA